MKRTNFTRLLSGFLALVMVLMLVPVTPIRANAADGTTLYLKPSNSWKADGARFAVYYFDGSESTGWADMTDADGDGLYEAVIPGGYTTVIFCRMNPAIAENTWDARWNQTSDLALPTDGSNCYTTAEDKWDGDIGTWSVHTPHRGCHSSD